MPKGPKGEKRPRDTVGAAVKSMRILTGEDREEPVNLDTVDEAELAKIKRASKAKKKPR